MGFSVSGSAAIIFAAMFIAFGMWHTAATNGFERVSDAQEEDADRLLAQQNTAIVIDSAVADTGAGETRIRATNTGSTELSLNETDVLVDNEYHDGWQGNATLDGTSGTDLWLPGEQLEFNVSVGSAAQVKVVTETGVSDTSGVTNT